MHVIEARNANQMLPMLLYRLERYGVRRASRNGPVQVLEGPTTLVYDKPTERVVFWPERAANPFFHLLEALWMLAGREDVAFPGSIVARITQFSDDGKTLNGAYGKRWRSWFGYDQLGRIATTLRDNPDCRRQVLSMWDARHDLGLPSRDLPCNTHVYFARDRSGALDMTVCNRSNDAVWGAVGANVVQFSILQEYLAAWIGCPVGRYWQISNNMHLYIDQHKELMHTLAHHNRQAIRQNDPYEQGLVQVHPLVLGTNVTTFTQEVNHFLDEGSVLGIRSQFLRRVAIPMWHAIRGFKSAEKSQRCAVAMSLLRVVPASCDWGMASRMWVGWHEKGGE